MWPVIDTKEFLKKKKLENMQRLGKKTKNKRLWKKYRKYVKKRQIKKERFHGKS